MKKEQLREIGKLTGAYMGFLAGSGVATGQELLQYYSPWGFQAFGTAAVITGILITANVCYACAGKGRNPKEEVNVFCCYCGPHIGKFFEGFSVLFCFLSYVVMAAGAASVLEQQYGLPLPAGVLLICSVTALTVVRGMDRMVGITGKIGPLLLGIVFTVALIQLGRHGHVIGSNLEALERGELTITKAGENWLQAGISNGGFCLLWLPGFTSGLVKKHRLGNVVAASVLSGILLVSVNLTVGFAILARLNLVGGLQIPNLYLAAEVWPVLGDCFGVLIFLAIYGSSMPLLWTVSTRFAKEKSRKHRISVYLTAAAAGSVALFLPFSRLMNVVYVINGYVGFLLLLCMLGHIVVRILRQHRASMV